MSTLTLRAPAKINLSLRILGKRTDGFHELESLMVKLPGLADTLSFEQTGSFSFACSHPELPTGDDNLVVRAAMAFADAAKVELRHRITLDKVIPHGAGLGGGSSDAATALLGLNQIHDQVLGIETLQSIAASLGSDIPFFLMPGAARVSGRGERLAPAGPVPELPLLLLKPSFGVATPDAYRRWQTAVALPGIDDSPQKLPNGLELVNDLERPVFAKHRFLAELKQWLMQRPDTLATLLCGSGSTTFTVLADGADARAIAADARAHLDPTLWDWTGRSGV